MPTNKPITRFRETYRWLSNFYPAEVFLDEVNYPTAEHAYVAAKTYSPAERLRVRCCMTPGDAKRYGRTLALRPDWPHIKLKVMEDLLRQKFAPGTPLADKLLETGDCHIEEGNSWNDTFWGVCNGTGENHLGNLLMMIRGDLKNNARTIYRTSAVGWTDTCVSVPSMALLKKEEN